jgi:hypothetical protein
MAIQISSKIKLITKYHYTLQNNYFANVACENIMNLLLANFDQNNLSSIKESLYSNIDFVYDERFNFVIRINTISSDGSINIENNFYEINGSQENISPIETQIFCSNRYLLASSLDESLHDDLRNETSFLITIDVFSKDHNLLKRFISIK